MATAKAADILKQAITVKRNETEPEALEVIADSIIKVAEAFEAIKNSRLHARVVVLLLRDRTGLGINEIEKVLDAGSKLRGYIKPAPPKASAATR